MNNRYKWRNDVYLKLQRTETVVYLEFIRNVIKRLPGVTEKLCYSTPAFYADKKLFARMKEDCETLVIQTFEREKWMDADPATFFVTDHYLNSDYMLIVLKTVSPDGLLQLLETAWLNRASRKSLKEYVREGEI